MAEIKQIGSISVVTDFKTSIMYHTVDVIGGFDEQELKQHIQKSGYAELLETLAWMSYQVWNTVRELNAEKDAGTVAAVGNQDT